MVMQFIHKSTTTQVDSWQRWKLFLFASELLAHWIRSDLNGILARRLGFSSFSSGQPMDWLRAWRPGDAQTRHTEHWSRIRLYFVLETLPVTALCFRVALGSDLSCSVAWLFVTFNHITEVSSMTHAAWGDLAHCGVLKMQGIECPENSS